MRIAQWVVGDNMPGYMPDREPFGAEDWEHAQQCLRSTIYEDSLSEDEGNADLQQSYEDAISALDALPNGQEFGYTVNNRHYWIAKV